MENLNSSTLFERAKACIPGGVHSPVRAFRGVGGVPPFISRAKDDLLFDVDGNSYVDFCMSWGPLIFGHQNHEISEAIRESLSRGWTFGTADPYSLILAEFMTEELPWVEKVRFVNSGTEAVLSALRLARGATGRSKILKFDGCYHGHVDSMLVRAGSGLAEQSTPDSAGVSPQTASETLVAPLGDLEAVRKIFQEEGSELAAVILEPLPANNGLLIQEASFLKEIKQLTHMNGSLLIFDEVISGFRVAFGGMAEITGIQPDLVTYGKIIGGGFPVGAYGGRKDLMDQIAPDGPVYQAGTLSGNPVAMVAGHATLSKLKRDQPYGKLEEKTRALVSELQAVAFQKGEPVHFQSTASLFWSHLEARPVHRAHEISDVQKERYAPLFHALLKKGFYLAPSGYEVAFLSTAHSDDHLSDFVRAYENVLL